MVVWGRVSKKLSDSKERSMDRQVPGQDRRFCLSKRQENGKELIPLTQNHRLRGTSSYSPLAPIPLMCESAHWWAEPADLLCTLRTGWSRPRLRPGGSRYNPGFAERTCQIPVNRTQKRLLCNVIINPTIIVSLTVFRKQLWEKATYNTVSVSQYGASLNLSQYVGLAGPMMPLMAEQTVSFAKLTY